MTNKKESKKVSIPPPAPPLISGDVIEKSNGLPSSSKTLIIPTYDPIPEKDDVEKLD
jgi:hypothetical protein